MDMYNLLTINESLIFIKYIDDEEDQPILKVHKDTSSEEIPELDEELGTISLIFKNGSEAVLVLTQKKY